MKKLLVLLSYVSICAMASDKRRNVTIGVTEIAIGAAGVITSAAYGLQAVTDLNQPDAHRNLGITAGTFTVSLIPLCDGIRRIWNGCKSTITPEIPLQSIMSNTGKTTIAFVNPLHQSQVTYPTLGISIDSDLGSSSTNTSFESIEYPCLTVTNIE